MQKTIMYIFVLVIGIAIGVPVGVFVLSQQTPSIEEQIKVTIQGIEYKVSDSVLEIELLNDVPEKNLEGKVVVSQDENQWTGDVNWYYTDYGEAEILCESIDETKSFRVTYNENYPQATYLNRIIEWNEITINNQGASVSQSGSLLSVENVRFYVHEQTQRIEIVLRNSGTADSEVKTVYVGTTSSNLVAQTVVSYNPTTRIVSGGETITITLQYTWEEGTRYYFNVATEKGISLPFNKECSGFTIGFMETSELTVTQMTFDTTNNNMTVSLTNSGTSEVTISLVKVNGNTIASGSLHGDAAYGFTFDAGQSGSIVIDLTAITAGNKYAVNMFANDGTLIGSFTDTA